MNKINLKLADCPSLGADIILKRYRQFLPKYDPETGDKIPWDKALEFKMAPFDSLTGDSGITIVKTRILEGSFRKKRVKATYSIIPYSYRFKEDETFAGHPIQIDIVYKKANGVVTTIPLMKFEK